RLGRETLLEVVALEQPGDGDRPREANDLREVELREPLAVEADLRLLGVDDLRGLLEVPLRVRVDLLVREHRPFGRPARGIADPAGVVADDQDTRVTRALERG